MSELKNENLSPCSECGARRINQGNVSDGRCGKCKHREKMRLKAREPEQKELNKKKLQEKRALRALLDAESGVTKTKEKNELAKGEIFLLTRFEDSRLSRKSLDPLRIFGGELDKLEKLELIKRDQEDYILTEKGLESLENWYTREI